MVKDLSPEERLLRLIKGAHKKDESAAGKIEPASQEIPAPSDTIVRVQKQTPARERLILKKPIDPFKAAIFLLIGFFVLGIFYLSYELFGGRQQPSIIDIDKLIPQESESQESEQPSQQPQEQIPEQQMPAEEPIPAETEEFPPEVRELFGAPVIREEPSVTEGGPSLPELAKDIVLVGVITGDNPQAIIQDRRTRQTFYVSEGESVLGFKIKKVEKATVILERNGETIKLSL